MQKGPKKRTLLTETKKTKSKSMTEVCRIAKETHTSDKHDETSKKNLPQTPQKRLKMLGNPVQLQKYAERAKKTHTSDRNKEDKEQIHDRSMQNRQGNAHF